MDSKMDPFGSANLYSVPVGTKVKQFVGEGSANVVIELDLPEGTSAATREFFEGMLHAQYFVLKLETRVVNTETQANS